VEEQRLDDGRRLVDPLVFMHVLTREDMLGGATGYRSKA
jgi:hypothetical protein